MIASAWRRVRDFSGLGNDATYLWPRWIVLRAVGIVYVVIFAGIIVQARVLIGPEGISPLRDVLADTLKQSANALSAFLRVPSIFWLGSGDGMILAVAALGLAAALALALNLWPRLALFVCWMSFLSFVSLGQFFAATQPDQLMIEFALLCIPFAPRGIRPGLGEASPPRPIALFTVRWLLFCVMFEAGLAKFVLGGPLWRNLTAMDVMYQSAPFPTILGYFDFHLPHAYHVLEIFFTFLVEIAAPLIAVFGGRRGRWFAFIVWILFHAGIQLTNNFGWLNLASIAMGFLFLDDQMLASVRPSRAAPRAAPLPPAVSPFHLWGLRGALGLHLFLALCAFFLADSTLAAAVPDFISRPVLAAFAGFRSSNGYLLFGNIATVRYEVEFQGSNDGGETWRTYDFRYLPQEPDRISPFIAPWYPRFEAILQSASVVVSPPSPLFPDTAARLLQRDPRVIALFRRNPFPGRPVALIRMPVYQLRFTDASVREKTGDYWTKEYKGDYMAMLYLDEHGDVQQAP